VGPCRLCRITPEVIPDDRYPVMYWVKPPGDFYSCSFLPLPKQLGQPRDVDRDPSRSSFVSTFGCRASSSLSRE
jgi:hypothetical protein